MTQAAARKLVLASCVGLLVISFYRSSQGEEQGSLYRRLWGTSILAVLLSALADFAPEIAGPFAGLAFLGSLTNGGDKALQQALGGFARGGTGTFSSGRRSGNIGPMGSSPSATRNTVLGDHAPNTSQSHPQAS